MWKTICEKYNKTDVNFVKHVLYGAFLMGLFVLTLWVCIDSPAQRHFKELANNDVWFGDNWHYVQSNETVDTQGGRYLRIRAENGEAVITKVIDYTPNADEYMCFRVRAQEVSVYANDRLLYQNLYNEKYKDYANQIYLLHEMSVNGVQKGDTITIKLSCQNRDFFRMQFNAVGDRYALTNYIISKSGNSLGVCVVALILILLNTVVTHSHILAEKLHDMRSLNWLSAFLALAVVYLFADSGCMEMFVDKTGVISWFHCLSLMLLPIPFILFTKHAFFPGHKRYDVLIFLNVVLCTVCISGFVLFAFNMVNFFLYVHIMIVAEIAACVISFIQEKITPAPEVIGGFCAVFVGAMAGIVAYWYSIAMPASVIFGYGLLIFSVCMLIWVVRSRYEIYKMRCEADHIFMERDKRAAEKANEQKSRFLSHMSHEIRTPLNAILGMNQLIMREAVNENVKKYSNNIQNAGDTLLGIINDVLDFSKIETGKIDIIDAEYSLSALLNDIVVMIQGRAETNGLELKIEVDGNIPDALYGDEIRVKQVIINLMTNAVKYTKEGWIKLSVGMRAVSNYLDDDNLVLVVHVSDSGMGIKEEERDKLFSEFARLDQRKNKSIEGTGLGLSITAQLVSLMKGKISVDSVYGEGSVFTVEIPQRITAYAPIGDYRERFEALADEELRKEEESCHDEMHFKGKRVFVADDNEMNLEVIAALLEMLDLEVIKAGGGQEAIERLDKEKFDLIFMDDMMPEIGGKQVMRHIRDTESSVSHTTPIVVLTANAMAGAREEYIALGFDDYMTKPIDVNLLQKILIKYLK